MSAWTLVPCLATLRSEFNAVAPARDKGADGSIGDSNHNSASDHAADEDSDVLRDHDADAKNEVHALDIDSGGPWPAPGWFDATIKALVAREKTEYESPTMVGRLQYVIWAGRIASRSQGWVWRIYTGPSKHFDHAHFSARYLTSTEADTRPWGVQKEDDVALTGPEIAQIADAVWAHVLPNGYTAEKNLGILDVRSNDTTNKRLPDVQARLALVQAALARLEGKDYVDEQAVIAGVLAGLPADQIAAAIPSDLAERVAQQLVDRLQS